MAKIEFFSPPDGAFIDNPSSDWLEDLILNKGEDYWNAGAGQASLKREEDGRSTELLVTRTSRGIYLEFIDANNVYFVSVGEGTFEETVEVYVGGDPLILPTAFLISKELAATAVKEFCHSGQRSKSFMWKKRSEVNWYYGRPNET